MPTLDALYADWERTQSVRDTLSVLEALRGQGETARVTNVCKFATTSMWSNVPVLILAGRVYMEDGRLSEAQATLVAAGKIAPQNGEVYRWLGEVLILRNDHERALKVLERAVQFSGESRELRALFARARGETPPPPSGRSSSRPAPPVSPALSPRAPSVSPRVPPVQRVDDDAITAFDARKAPLPSSDIAPLRSIPIPSRSAPPPSKVFPSDRPAIDLPPPPSIPPPIPSAPTPLVAASKLEPAPLTEADFDSGQPRVLDPREVLNALSVAGIYDSNQSSKPLQWDRVHRAPIKRSSLAFLAGGLVAMIVGIGGVFFFVRERRERDHIEAESLLAKVDADLKQGKTELLAEDEKSIGRSFELDSRSPHAAITWMKERAVLGLLRGGSDVALEEAISRAKEVGVPEASYAFAEVASFLFQGDTSGAVAFLPKRDKAAEHDAYYQLLAGTVLERIGDAHAVERYRIALTLDPDFVMAEIAALRALVLDPKQGDAKGGLAAFRAKRPERAEGSALAALAWGRDPMRDPAAADVDEAVKRAAELPQSLKMVPSAVNAIKAINQKNFDSAKTEVAAALGVATDPSAATWLGLIALETGDEALARKAALTAVSFSAVYPQARVLAGRVALLGNRLDEALKATEDLDAHDPDVALVRTVVAYERLDLDAFVNASDNVPIEARPLSLSVLGYGKGALSGNSKLSGAKLAAFAASDAPWADIVAADIALDTGDLTTMKTIAAQWAATDARPSRALRLSRFARYSGQKEDADRWSKMAISQGSVTLRALLERVFVLVDIGKAHDVAALVRGYPVVFGPLAKWANAYASASSGKIEEARAKVSTEDPPATTAPYASRAIALSAMGAMKDVRRGNPYIRPILVDGLFNPDVADVVDQFHMPPIRRTK